MTAAAWSAGLACVGALMATVWLIRRDQPKPEQKITSHLVCTRCSEYLGEVEDEGDLQATWLLHHALRHAAAPPGVDPL